MSRFLFELNPRNVADSEDIHKVLTEIPNGFWEKNKAYTTSCGTTFTFTNDIIFCEDNPPEENCYKVISTGFLCNEGNTKISYIAYSFVFNSEQELKILPATTQELVKKITNSRYPSKKVFYEDATEEFDNSVIIEHLGVKRPLRLIGNSAYFVLREMPGISLFDFIIDVILRRKVELPTSILLALTDAILISIREQVVKYNIQHLDIKPENFILNFPKAVLSMSQEELTKFLFANLTINCIDYAFGRKFTSPQPKRVRGTRTYVAPEVLAEKSADKREKPDIFAAGIILQFIWNLYSFGNYSANKHILDTTTMDLIYNRVYASRENAISRKTFNQICALAINMTSINPDDRYSLDRCIRALTHIIQTSYHEPNEIFVATRGYEVNQEEVHPMPTESGLKYHSGPIPSCNREATAWTNQVPQHFQERRIPQQQTQRYFKKQDASGEHAHMTTQHALSNLRLYKDTLATFTRMSMEVKNNIKADIQEMSDHADGKVLLKPASGCLKTSSGNTFPFWRRRNPTRSNNVDLATTAQKSATKL